MKSKLNITPEAERDIFTITANIKLQDSLRAARDAISKIEIQIKVLSEKPDIGRAGGCEGTREVVLSGLPYIAIYEKTDTSITILRVLYGAEERRLDKRI